MPSNNEATAMYRRLVPAFISRRWTIALLGTWLAGTSIAGPIEAPKNFVVHEVPRPVAPTAFQDEQGRLRSLDDFRGKVVLLNIWATWCSPCRREMPALDRLQAALGSAEFEVVALSIDRAGIEPVRRFYGEVGAHHLAIYVDRTGKAPRELAVVGIPTTLLIDREGRELGRLTGPAEWDAPETIGFLKAMIARQRAGADPALQFTASAKGRT
jgi:thiol-disulfide isomerase/thioredoxin